MSPKALQRTASRLFLIVPLALASWHAMAAPQDGAAQQTPRDAHAKHSGREGWECDRGYNVVDHSCVAIEVPANAYLDAFGRGWECDRGYRKVGRACAAIDLPEHAFLVSRESWECDRGYRRADQSCAAFAVPENG
jgi:hypothetical protein